MENKNKFYFDDLTDEEKGFINVLRYKGGYFFIGLGDAVNFNYKKPNYAKLGVWANDYPHGDIPLKEGLFSFIDMNTCWKYDPWSKEFIKLENK